MNQLPQSVQIELLEAMLDGSRVAALVTDPSQPDNPIIYANQTFETMTGYPVSEVVGNNCRFLQGEDTDPEKVSLVRNAILQKEEVTVTLKNYKKDGTAFWNRLTIKPLQIADRFFFIGTQTNVTVEHTQRNDLSAKELEIEQLMLPIIMIKDNLAAVSLIGEMSPIRFSILIQKLSEFVQLHGVHNVVIDITGIYSNQGFLSNSLLAVQDVLKLMGTRLYITGISPEMAQSLVASRDISNQLHTFSSIQQAIKNIH